MNGKVGGRPHPAAHYCPRSFSAPATIGTKQSLKARVRRFIFLSWSLALAAAICIPAMAADSELSILPSRVVRGRVMQLVSTPQTLAIAEKLRVAMASQPEWTRQFIAENSAPGKPLPYHPNLGITREDYEAFLKSKLALVQIGTVDFSAESQKDGSIRIVTFPASSRLNGVTIAAGGETVLTALATLLPAKPINNQDRESATGRWEGKHWRYESTDSDHALAVQLAIGTRTDSGDGIIYYDVVDVQGQTNGSFSEVILFPISK